MSADADTTTAAAVDELPGFRPVAREELRWSERITRADYLRRWTTVSTLLVADPETRAEMLGRISSILDEHPDTRDADDFDLPLVTDVFVYRRA